MTAAGPRAILSPMNPQRTRLFTGAALGLLLLGAGGSEDAIDWVPSFEEGRRLAREGGKPLMVVFR